MVQAKHTPGPWWVGYGTKVCAVYMKPANEGVLVRDQIARFDRNEEGVANARLIAGAPDLLQALEGLLKILSDMRADEGIDASSCNAGGILFGDVASEALEAAEAALAKAAGAQ